jgi:hypothetical protein
MNVSPFAIQLTIVVILLLAVMAWTLRFALRAGEGNRRAYHQGARQGAAEGLVSDRYANREPRALWADINFAPPRAASDREIDGTHQARQHAKIDGNDVMTLAREVLELWREERVVAAPTVHEQDRSLRALRLLIEERNSVPL